MKLLLPEEYTHLEGLDSAQPSQMQHFIEISLKYREFHE